MASFESKRRLEEEERRGNNRNFDYIEKGIVLKFNGWFANKMTRENSWHIQTNTNEQNEPREKKIDSDTRQEEVGSNSSVTCLFVVLMASSSAHASQAERVQYEQEEHKTANAEKEIIAFRYFKEKEWIKKFLKALGNEIK